MSTEDMELREFFRLLYRMIDLARYGMEVITYDDCNTCGKTKCKYMPKPGDMVRINCPLWRGADEEE